MGVKAASEEGFTSDTERQSERAFFSILCKPRSSAASRRSNVYRLCKRRIFNSEEAIRTMRIAYPVSPEDVVSEACDREERMAEVRSMKHAAQEELSVNGIKYEEPWCCGGKMFPQYTFKDTAGNLHRTFICYACRRKKSIQVTRGGEVG
jgi:hypothetical protein